VYTDRGAFHKLLSQRAELASWSSMEMGSITQSAQSFGSACPQFLLGRAHADGIMCVTQDAAEARSWWQKSAEQLFLPACAALGADLLTEAFESGAEQIELYEAASRWLVLAAEAGDPVAQFNAAVCCKTRSELRRRGAERQALQDEAARWLRLAAGQGERRAVEWLARDSWNGVPALGVARDRAEARRLWAVADAVGATAYDRTLRRWETPGWDVHTGQGITDPAPAPRTWGDEPYAPHAMSQPFGVAALLRGVPARSADDVVLCRVAAVGGNVQSQAALAAELLRGDDAACASDALEWARLAAGGSSDLGASIAAALLLVGRGTEASPTQAVSLLQRAAEAGGALSQFGLAHCYECGAGVAVDVEAAARWYQLAAEDGVPAAMEWMAFACHRGAPGVSKDAHAAFCWARRGAAQGNNPACITYVGNALMRGGSVAKDMAAGVEWLRRGADAGDVGARVALSGAYWAGIGVARDVGEAETSGYRCAETLAFRLDAMGSEFAAEAVR
jgi:hypothetical protein